MQGSISFDGTLAGSIAGGGGGGTTPVINADATVDSLSGDPTCIVSKTGTDEMPTFHFAFSGIVGEEGPEGPQGPQGETGATGAQGPQGPAGVGVPSGGATGDVLRKDSTTDYNTYWDTLTALDIPYDNTISGMTATNTQAAITELKSNLTQLNGLNVIKRINTPASVVSFSDGSNLPMYKLKIEIDNVSGCTEANVTRCGKNLAEDGFTWNINANGIIETITLYNTSIVSVRKNESYIQTINGVLTNIGVIAFYYERPSIGSQSYNKSRSVSSGSPIFTAPIDGYAVIRNVASDTNIQIEKGNTATAYEPYNGQTYNIQFKDGTNPLTVYGGTLDIITGLLTVNDTTPPTYYNLSPISAITLTGNNNIYCDTGNIIEVDYTGVINFS